MPNNIFKTYNKKLAISITDGKWKMLDTDDILWIPSGNIMSSENVVINIDDLYATVSDLQNKVGTLESKASNVLGLYPDVTSPLSDTIIINEGTYRNFENNESIRFLGGISPQFQPVINKSRIDLIGLDINQNIVIVQGSENDNPFPPNYPPYLTIVAEIYVNEKNNVIISKSDITDVRDVVGSRSPVIDGGTFF